MKIKFLDGIEPVIMGHVPSLKEPVYSAMTDYSEIDMPDRVQVKHQVTLHFRQAVDLSIVKSEIVHRHAVRAISKTIFGEIENEIYDVLMLLWGGTQDDVDRAKERLERMIPVLRGEQP